MNRRELRILIRNFAIELVLYGILVVAYFLIVLRLLGEPLARLFHDQRIVYAFVGLVLIVAQGLVLEVITSFLLDQLKLERLE